MKKIKPIKIVGWLVKIFLFIILIAFILSVFLQRFSNNEFSFFNYRIFSVLTGSMIPKYNVGDILISKEVDPEEIKVGDSVSYLGKEGDFKNKVVTHDVIEIVENEDGTLSFITQGVANDYIDPVVDEDQIYGIVTSKSYILSTVYGIVSTPTGMYLFIILPILGIIGYEVVSRMIEKEDKRRNTRDF